MRLIFKIALLCLTIVIVILLSERLKATYQISYNDEVERFLAELTIKDGVVCWLEICPGRTTLDEVEPFLLSSGHQISDQDFRSIRFQISGEIFADASTVSSAYEMPLDVLSFEFTAVKPTLGKLVLKFGTPISIERDAASGTIWQRGVCFEAGACIFVRGQQSKIDPNLSVISLILFPSVADGYSFGYNYMPWQGFRSLPLS